MVVISTITYTLEGYWLHAIYPSTDDCIAHPQLSEPLLSGGRLNK